MKNKLQGNHFPKHFGRVAFCREKLIFGLVVEQDYSGKVTKLWTPIGVIETIQLSIIIIKSLWDLYKLIRAIWKEIKGSKSNLNSGFRQFLGETDDNL